MRVYRRGRGWGDSEQRFHTFDGTLQLVKAIVLFAVILTGCDVPGRLVLVNRSGYPATVRTIMKGEDHSDQRVDSLDATGPKRKSHQIFGFGWNWSDKNIENYVSRIDRIDIITKADSTSVSGQQPLFDLLRNSRCNGLMKKNAVMKIR